MRERFAGIRKEENMLINDVSWARPVTVRLQCGLERTFLGAYDALDFLQNEWPLRHGEPYERAVKTCCGASGGATPLVVSREAFVAACLEAGMAAIVAPRKTTPQLHSRPVRPVHHA
jgi:hypothetical protein